MKEDLWNFLESNDGFHDLNFKISIYMPFWLATINCCQQWLTIVGALDYTEIRLSKCSNRPLGSQRSNVRIGCHEYGVPKTSS